MNSPSRPFPKSSLWRAVQDKNRAEVERLLALCTCQEHVDDGSLWTSFHESVFYAGEHTEIPQLIWARYKKLGCNLKAIINRTLHDDLIHYYDEDKVVRYLQILLPFYREVFGEDTQTQLRQTIKACYRKSLNQTNIMNTIFPPPQSRNRDSSDSNNQDATNTATKRSRDSTNDVSPARSSKKPRPLDIPTVRQPDNSSTDERKPAAQEAGERQATATTIPVDMDTPTSSPATAARASTSTTNATRPRTSVRSLLCMLEDDLEIEDHSGTSKARVRRVKRELLGDDDEESVPASLSLVKQLSELASILGVDSNTLTGENL
jgi:hypothetical protein